jgi:hypothetical protein
VADFWVCAACRSINRPHAGRCYSCRARRDAAAAELGTLASPTPVLTPAPTPTRARRPRRASPEPQPVTSTTPERLAAPQPVVAPEPIPGPQPSAGFPAWAPTHRGVVVKRVQVGGVVLASIAVLVGGGLLLASRSAGPPTDGLHTLSGRLDLVQARPGQPPSFESGDGQSCYGVGAFRDIRLGMPVSVEDLSGTLVGQGWLEDGRIAPGGSATPATCGFQFHADLRPATAYRVIPGNRDAIEQSADDLSASGWTLSITIRP